MAFGAESHISKNKLRQEDSTPDVLASTSKEVTISPAYQLEPAACLPEKPQFPGSCTVISGLRYYNSSSGEWLNRDPIGETGGVNLYSFVRNNAVNHTDFLGLDGDPTFDKKLDGASAAEKKTMAEQFKAQIKYIEEELKKCLTPERRAALLKNLKLMIERLLKLDIPLPSFFFIPANSIPPGLTDPNNPNNTA